MAHSDQLPEPDDCHDLPGRRRLAGQGQPGKQTNNGEGLPARLRTIAAARAAKAARPMPENCEAVNTWAAGNAARITAGAPRPQVVTTWAPAGTWAANCAQAARQPALPEREPPKPNVRKLETWIMTKQEAGKWSKGATAADKSHPNGKRKMPQHENR